MSDFLQTYRAHVAERAALGIPPLPLSAKQVAEVIELLKTPPKGEEAFLMDLLTAAQRAQWAPISFEGRLHDRASYRYYWQLLERGRRTGVPLPQAAQGWFE